MTNLYNNKLALLAGAIFAATLTSCDTSTPKSGSQSSTKLLSPIKVHDPGVRQSDPGAGAALAGLDEHYLKLFKAGKTAFETSEDVKTEGLGPTFNLDSCQGCHAYPDTGGSSPGPTKSSPKTINPQYTFWSTHLAKTNIIPSFIKGDDPKNPGFTPVREARFIRIEDDATKADGGVHALFTIVGLEGAEECKGLNQPDFEKAIKDKNIIYRIPTPVFGGGLIEQIPDSAIVENLNKQDAATKAYGISGKLNITLTGNAHAPGQANHNGNDGTIARFGWKAQNKSLLIFAGEAYNVEMGVSNELFPTEREENASCQVVNAPNDRTHPEETDLMKVLSDVEKFAAYMRLLAPPEPSKHTPGGSNSIEKGSILFKTVGCALCHTPQFTTGKSDIPQLDRKPVNLYSDLLVHNMGKKLADGVKQGQADEYEFRSAPLWGLGQRTWFLHDGRTADLITAIEEHESHRNVNDQHSDTRDDSEANQSVAEYNALPNESKQDLLNFLRSL